MTNRIKVITGIPDAATLKAIIGDYKAIGAEVGWAEDADGRFSMEAILPEAAVRPTVDILPNKGTRVSPVSGRPMRVA